MANMGSTGTVNITKAMMDAAIKAVDDYQSQVTGINSELQSEIDGLIPSSFSGAAANGFKAFYDTSILPNVTDNLTKMLLFIIEENNQKIINSLLVNGKKNMKIILMKL